MLDASWQPFAGERRRQASRARVLSRRDFVRGAASVLGAGAVAPAAWLAGSAPAGAVAIERMPVLGFHLDRPYWDPTGTAEVYRPPAGSRSGDALAAAAEGALIGQFGY